MHSSCTNELKQSKAILPLRHQRRINQEAGKQGLQLRALQTLNIKKITLYLSRPHIHFTFGPCKALIRLCM